MARKRQSNTTKDRTVIQTLKDMVGSEAKAYWILWKYAPEMLSGEYKTFDELQAAYVAFKGTSEEAASKYIYQDVVQKGAKYILKKLDTKRDIELYNEYYKLAMNGDVQALKAYMEFKKDFFKENEENELMQILRGVDVDDTEDEDFEMKF